MWRGVARLLVGGVNFWAAYVCLGVKLDFMSQTLYCFHAYRVEEWICEADREELCSVQVCEVHVLRLSFFFRYGRGER